MHQFLMVQWLNSHLNIGLPEDLHDRIRKHPEIRWAAVARELITQYVEDLEKVQREQHLLLAKKINSEDKS
jgi:hypothetical protein